MFGENTARAGALQSDAALEVIADGLEQGADPREFKRAARLLQEYELQFWDTVAEVP